MIPKTRSAFLFVLVIFVLLLSACASPATEIPATNTPVPTMAPTETPRPTATPNATATELASRSDLMRAEIQPYVDAGYLSKTDGTYLELPDFEEEWAQIGWYQWWPTETIANPTFVLTAHLKSTSAATHPDISGCGVGFDVSGEYNAGIIFLDRSTVLFLNVVGYPIGKTKGTGRVNLSIPAEADLTVVANQNVQYVLVDNELVSQYAVESLAGPIGYSVLSGTNKDFGTRCEITNVRLWNIEE